jgi:hypothetical protein
VHQAADGGNGALVVGATLDTLRAKQSAEVALALVMGNSLEELQQAVEAARAYYQHYRRHPLRLPAVPVCTGQTATVRVPGETSVRFYADAGGITLLAEGEAYETGAINQDTVVYVASLRDGYEASVRQIPIVITEPVAQFAVDAISNPGFRNDTLFLDETNNHALRFQDSSSRAVAWEWNFGNDTGSTEPQPTAHFDEPGRYAVTLTARSEPGCVSQTTRTITVIPRAEHPLVSDHTVLPSDTLTDSTQLTSVASQPANQEAKAIRLYPNPTAGEVRVENPHWDRQTVHLRLSTLRGQELGRWNRPYDGFSLPIDLHQLAGRPLPAGVYLLHVYRGERVFVRRVVVR